MECVYALMGALCVSLNKCVAYLIDTRLNHYHRNGFYHIYIDYACVTATE